MEKEKQEEINSIKFSFVHINDKMSKNQKDENTTKKEEDDKDFAQEFAKKLQETSIAQDMNEDNRNALDVMAKEGSAAAVKYMMTDQKTGAARSYAEMRMLYG